LLDAGVARAELITLLSERYVGEPTEIVSAVDAFVEQLVQKTLIVPRDADDQLKADASELLTAKPVPQAFAPPTLEQYTDMQELLLLDPIHEVDEQGWPLQRQ
jgi:hypothetical protein